MQEVMAAQRFGCSVSLYNLYEELSNETYEKKLKIFLEKACKNAKVGI